MIEEESVKDNLHQNNKYAAMSEASVFWKLSFCFRGEAR